jgi:putative transcriptional regulator
MSLWMVRDISFDFVDDLTDDPVVTLRIFTPVGPLTFIAQPVMVELAAAGIAAVWIQPDATVDVRALRERLDLTREQFAMRYGLEVETLRNWETGKREPDTTARSYLRAIANAPESVERAYAPTPPL